MRPQWPALNTGWSLSCRSRPELLHSRLPELPLLAAWRSRRHRRTPGASGSAGASVQVCSARPWSAVRSPPAMATTMTATAAVAGSGSTTATATSWAVFAPAITNDHHSAEENSAWRDWFTPTVAAPYQVGTRELLRPAGGGFPPAPAAPPPPRRPPP